jgi:hypothetical protein
MTTLPRRLGAVFAFAIAVPIPRLAPFKPRVCVHRGRGHFYPDLRPAVGPLPPVHSATGANLSALTLEAAIKDKGNI